MQRIAQPPGLALAARNDHARAGLLHQPRRERHGVGIPAEKWRPQSQPLGRHLVGQQAHGFAAAQRLDHLAHARQRSRHGLHAGSVARGGHHLGQPGLARGPVENRDRPMLRTPALRRGLHRQLEAAQMRRQEDDAPALGPGLLDALGPYHFAALGRGAQPHARQLGDQAARMAHGRSDFGKAVARLACVLQEAAAVGGRDEEHQPPQDSAQTMQKPQRQQREQTEQAWH